MLRLCCLNGSIMPVEEAFVNVEDRGYQFGDGVYEVFRLYHGKPFAMRRHLKRLSRSLKMIKIDFPDLEQSLYKVSEQLIRDSKIEHGYIYAQITRGTATRDHLFPLDPLPPVLSATITSFSLRTPEQFEQGVKTVILSDDRWLHCNIKSLNLLPNVLAKDEARSRGADEAILARDLQTVTEGASCNVFIVKDGIVFTHPDGPLILPGITKELVLEIAGDVSITVYQQPFTVRQLRQADEVFITDTLHEVCPVVAVDGMKVGDGGAGTVARALQDAYTKYWRNTVAGE